MPSQYSINIHNTANLTTVDICVYHCAQLLYTIQHKTVTLWLKRGRSAVVISW